MEMLAFDCEIRANYSPMVRTRPDVKPMVFLLGGKDCVTLLSDVGVVVVDVWLVGIWAQLPNRDCRGLEVGEQFGFV